MYTYEGLYMYIYTYIQIIILSRSPSYVSYYNQWRKDDGSESTFQQIVQTQEFLHVILDVYFQSVRDVMSVFFYTKCKSFINETYYYYI